MKRVITFAMTAATGMSAHADIVRVNEFKSVQFEGFNNLDMGSFERDPVDAFGGLATLFNTENSFLHTTGGWSHNGNWRTSALEGGKMLGTTRGGVEYQFNTVQRSFGGYFSTIDEQVNGTIKFYNGSNLVGSDTLVTTNDGDWSWNGWSSDTSFDSVVVESISSGKGFLLHDAVRVMSTEVPAPGSLAMLAAGGVIAVSRRRTQS